MLLPKKVLHRKWHKGRRRNKGVATRTNTVAFGTYGMKSLGHDWITSRQIEAARKVLTRYVRKVGKIWIRVFPDKPITERAAESRMGAGKGAPAYWVAVIKPGHILFEINGLEKELAFKVLKTAAYKLPVKTKIVTRGNL